MLAPKDLLEPLALDALLVTRPENVRYLSGFPHPEDAQVLVTGEGPSSSPTPATPRRNGKAKSPPRS